MAHLSLTTLLSSSTQRILAIRGDSGQNARPATCHHSAAEPCLLSNKGAALLRQFLTYRFGLREQVQVIRSSGLRIGSGHVEAAERMRPHHRSRTFAID